MKRKEEELRLAFETILPPAPLLREALEHQQVDRALVATAGESRPGFRWGSIAAAVAIFVGLSVFMLGPAVDGSEGSLERAVALEVEAVFTESTSTDGDTLLFFPYELLHSGELGIDAVHHEVAQRLLASFREARNP
jgi:hypothetical protein